MPQDLFSLTGKTALVTGAAGGLGFAIARSMAEAGAAVILTDRNVAGCAARAEELGAEGFNVWPIAADLSLPAARAALVEKATSVTGRVDILVCNAGVEGPVGPIGNVAEEDFATVMNVNLRAAMDLSARLIPGMEAAGGGSVILMASIASLRGNKAIGMYGLSKAALAQLARNLAVEWGPSNVRVNAISPGMVRTPLSQGLMANAAFMERRLGLTPLRRVGEPSEIAGVAVMLAAAAGAFITGQNIIVDGGTTISDGN
jgi:NAD(P)-dependent dehydrogenase (short-subunit alcohol dehydrogenase family)